MFVTGSTPFGIFDADAAFASDADKIDNFVRLKLGDPVMVVHLSSSQVYASFEEAALEYSAIVNSYQAKSVLAQFLGAMTGTLSGSENKYIQQNLEFQKKLAQPYGDAGNIVVNTQRPLYSASLMLQTGVQKYNLNPTIAEQLTGSAGNVSIKDLFHFSPLSAYRFFGTTSAINYLNAQFNFESFTPETIFYLLPIWEDILRGMQFETSNRVRRSNYSYELNNNVLTLYPVPTQDMPLFFTYMVATDPTQPAVFYGAGVSGSDVQDNSYFGVSNLSNVPFGNIEYSKLNSISKQWIRRMAFALSKEVEGQIRGKMATIPIPNGDLTLNGPELINDARAEQDNLRNELKQLLDDMTYDKLAARQAEMTDANNRVMREIPLGIYIG